MRVTIAYLSFCAITIALLVFLNATQPFVLSQIFGLQQNGSVSGLLALVDEVVSLIVAPLWGALSDKIGTRYCAVSGLLIMALGLEVYPRVSNVYPYLFLSRAVFSLGASACVSMITASLAELSLLAGAQPSSRGDYSEVDGSFNGAHSPNRRSPFHNDDNDGDETVPLFDSPITDDIFDTVVATPRPNGKLAGFAGFASGIGAVLAVSILLPLPTTLKGGAADGIKEAFSIVSIGSVIASVVLLFTLYQNPARGLRSFFVGRENVSIFDEAAVDAGGSVMSYLELLADGFMNARSDKRLQVAYFGSLVARSVSVILALFVPLWVNQWYYDNGLCTIDDPNGCRQAITQAAILTGIANTVMLLAAPVVGWAGDRYGSVKVLAFSSVLGFASMLGFIVNGKVTGVLAILVCSLAGCAQIGVVTMSMSMSTDKRRIAGGSVAGVYSFCGSLGILLVTQIGGPLADIWIKSPFVVMAVLFTLLTAVSQRLGLRTALRSVRSTTTLN